LNNLIELKKSRVGLAKSGWNSAARKLKTRIPKWVSRHGFSNGGYREQGKGTSKFVIWMSNRVTYIPNATNRIVKPALAKRAKSMESVMKRVIKKGADQYKFRKGI